MSLKALLDGPAPITAPLVLNPLMARMAESSGFAAGYLGGGATGYLKVALEANLNLTEMCQAAVDIRAVSSLPLIFDGACGFGDPMHMHRTIGMSEAAGFSCCGTAKCFTSLAAADAAMALTMCGCACIGSGAGIKIMPPHDGH